MYTIYALVDPSDGLIRYVGMAQDLYSRFIQHINCESRNAEKNLWIMGCRAKNQMVQMRTLDFAETREEALEAEKKWIAYYVALKMPLINKTIARELMRKQEEEELRQEEEKRKLNQQMEEDRIKLKTDCEKLIEQREALKSAIAKQRKRLGDVFLHEPARQQDASMEEDVAEPIGLPLTPEKIMAVYEPGISYRQLGAKIGVSKDTAGKLIKELKYKGFIDADGNVCVCK